MNGVELGLTRLRAAMHGPKTPPLAQFLNLWSLSEDTLVGVNMDFSSVYELECENIFLMEPARQDLFTAQSRSLINSLPPDSTLQFVVQVRRGDPGRPEICNVFSYDKLFGTPPQRIEEVDRTCRSGELGCREHKDELSERIVEYLRPFRERRQQALADRGQLERMLDEGAERAREIAIPIMESAKEAMGL
jgi:hypothetical protein